MLKSKPHKNFPEGCGPAGISPFFIKSPILDRFNAVTHAFTTRIGGISPPPFDSLNLSADKEKNAGNVVSNLNILKKAIAPKGNLLMLNQVHGDDILILEDCDNTKTDVYFDAVITRIEEQALLIRTADCLPLLLFDVKKKAISAVHAGWRGTAMGISIKTVDKMIGRFGCTAENMIAAFGPSIGPCCYEVDEKIYEKFRTKGRDSELAWSLAASEVKNAKGKRWMLNLAKLNMIQLINFGIKRKNISLTPFCTSCRRDLFFSHRRDGQRTGRQGALIKINRVP